MRKKKSQKSACAWVRCAWVCMRVCISVAMSVSVYKRMLCVCVCMYGTGKKKRLSYLVGNLVATNWPIEKALHAIGYNQIPTK